jgi:hypothetical protein
MLDCRQASHAPKYIPDGSLGQHPGGKRNECLVNIVFWNGSRDAIDEGCRHFGVSREEAYCKGVPVQFTP